MDSQDEPATLLRLDERLALLEWPELSRIDEIVIRSGDCLVVAMGFEDRAVAGLSKACKGSRGFDVGLVKYLPRIAENREPAFLEISRAHSLETRQFEYDRECPSGMGQSLADYAAEFDKVYVDISGMSRLLIVQIVVVLVQKGKEFDILYSEAEVYPPLQEAYEEARVDDGGNPSFISSGIFEVVSSPELSSVAMLGSSIRLISFLSFDPRQLSNLVQEIQPTHNNVVHGRSPHAEMAWRTDAIAQMNADTVNMLRRVEVHEASTLDYRITLRLILELYKRYSAFDRIVVAPTGSKMQAVAVGIVRGVMEDIQIVYPTPREYLDPARYTEGVKEIFRLSVGNVGLLDR